MASNISVSSLNGVKVYNLSTGKTLPQWLSEAKRRQLSQSAEFRHRVELIQDFRFPSGSQCIKLSRDGRFCIASGVYPPRLRTYELGELSMKFERFVEGKIVKMEVLSDDYRKLALLRSDRVLEFHAAWGYHYRTRIPTFGRDLAYNRYACNLYCAASGSDVYCLNLEQGQFSATLESGSAQGVNAVEINPVHQLVACGCADGVVRCFDPRASQTKPVASADVSDALGALGEDGVEVSALQFSEDGLHVGAGTSAGDVLLYDLRSSRPEQIKKHQYELPIHTIRFLAAQRRVLSADQKVLKIWEHDGGRPVTAIEPTADCSDVCVVPGSGLIFVAGEQERIMSYYIPALGPAPRWCHFLDGITEELEEENASEKHTVFNNYKFLPKAELNALGLSHLVGTNLLRAYMHGYFIDMRLYRKIQSASDPFSFEKWQKERVTQKISKRRAERITMVNRFKVNARLGEKLVVQQQKIDEQDTEEGAAAEKRAAPSLLTDQRFANMFNDEDFAIDTTSDAYLLRHGDAASRNRNQQASDQLWKDAFVAVDDKSDAGGRVGGSDESTDDEEERQDLSLAVEHGRSRVPEEQLRRERQRKAQLRRNQKKSHPTKLKKVSMFESRAGVNIQQLQSVTSGGSDNAVRQELRRQRQPLGKRLRQEPLRRKPKTKRDDPKVRRRKGAREITFKPTTTNSDKKRKKHTRR